MNKIKTSLNKEKKNILFIIPQLAKGGSEQLVLDLAVNLNNNLFTCSVAYFYYYDDLNFKRTFEEHGISLYHIPKEKRYDFKIAKKIKDLCQEIKVDIINAHHFISLFYSFISYEFFNNKVKIIYTEHSKWEIEKINTFWRLFGMYMTLRIDGMIGIQPAVSEALKYKFLINPNKIQTILNGTDLIHFNKPNTKSKIDKKKGLGLAPRDKVIGIVANLRKIKNHQFLLSAFKALVKEYQDVKLLIIGKAFESDSENTEPEIKNFIKINQLKNKILLLGKRNDISELLSIMDIFCLTSFKEGLPLSIIEAMASYLPIVGTNVEGINEIVQPRRNGFLIDLDDITSFKNALLTLLTKEKTRNYMGNESRKIVEQNYSLDNCVNKYKDYFLSILGD